MWVIQYLPYNCIIQKGGIYMDFGEIYLIFFFKSKTLVDNNFNKFRISWLYAWFWLFCCRNNNWSMLKNRTLVVFLATISTINIFSCAKACASSKISPGSIRSKIVLCPETSLWVNSTSPDKTRPIPSALLPTGKIISPFL